MAIEDFSDIIKTLGETEGIEVVCLVRKNGDVYGSAGDITSRQLESFGIMSATIYGAANTANDHLDKDNPSRITIEGSDGFTLITKVDDHYILVVRTMEGTDKEPLLPEIDTTAETLYKMRSG